MVYANRLKGIKAVVSADCIEVSGNTFAHRLWLSSKHKGGGRWDKESQSWLLPADRVDAVVVYLNLTEVI